MQRNRVHQITEKEHPHGVDRVDQNLLLLPGRTSSKEKAIRRKVASLYRNLERRLPLWRVCINTKSVEPCTEDNSHREDSVYVRSVSPELAKFKINKILQNEYHI